MFYHTAKSEMMGSNAAELWLEDIIDVVEAVERHAEKAGQLAGLLATLNGSLASNNDNTSVAILRWAMNFPIPSCLTVKYVCRCISKCVICCHVSKCCTPNFSQLKFFIPSEQS